MSMWRIVTLECPVWKEHVCPVIPYYKYVWAVGRPQNGAGAHSCEAKRLDREEVFPSARILTRETTAQIEIDV